MKQLKIQEKLAENNNQLNIELNLITFNSNYDYILVTY